MTAPKVVIDPRGRALAAMAANPDRAWQAVAWLGFLLAVVGLGDFVLAFIPSAFHTPEWEFATVAAVFAGLPLPTLGLAALLAAAFARGRRRTVLTLGTLMVVLGALVILLFVIFLTDVPIAMRSGAQGDILLGLKKAIAKTSLLGFVFGVAYLVAGIRALRAALSSGTV